MHFTALLPLVVLPLALAKDIPVKVGDQGNDFNPKTITGAKGDVVVFSFLGGDHSVAQSSFDKPCHPVDNAFYSGFIPGDKNSVSGILCLNSYISFVMLRILEEDHLDTWLFLL